MSHEILILKSITLEVDEAYRLDIYLASTYGVYILFILSTDTYYRMYLYLPNSTQPNSS